MTSTTLVIDTPAPGADWPAACTIVARNYLPQARMLAESYARQAPGARFYLLVIDGQPDGIELGAHITRVAMEELDLPGFAELTFKYDVTELATSVKPSLLSLLLDSRGEDAVVYFDPDILVERPLVELRDALATGDVVLTPHLLAPLPDDGKQPSEPDILIAGAYNLGFVAMKRSDTSRALLCWWADRLRDGCLVAPERGLMTDQRWVDLVPGMFPSTVLLRDPSYNVAYWNLPARSLTLAEGDASVLVDGRPLAFFHYSGFDPSSPHVLSKHQNRVTVTPGSPLAHLLDRYADGLLTHGFAQARRWPYGYGAFADGRPIPAVLRRLYHDLDESVRQGFGDPFQVGPGSFVAWALETPAETGGLSPFLAALYRARPDVAAVFPEARGRDRDAFVSWARRTGSREMGYAPSMASGPTEALLTVARRVGQRLQSAAATLPVAAQADASPPPPTVPQDGPLGVNVLGYLRTESGVGEAARGYIRALHGLGVPTTLTDLSQLAPNRAHHRTLELGGAAWYPINLVCVNADQHFVVRAHVGDERFRDHYNIGVWFWELSRFPTRWHDRFADYDEIWSASSFTADGIAAVSPIPVVVVPPVLYPPAAPGSRETGRTRIGATPEEFVFLCTFDFRSYVERKNPLGVIDAFTQAFTPADAARLVIKTINGDEQPDVLAAMRARAAQSVVTIEDGYWSAEDLRDLTAGCDAYVSLHRSEGLGLTIADAMGQGKPVIATGWSGNMDFMNEESSYPVHYDLVEIAASIGPYTRGEHWAEPSIEHAAELMRYVMEHPEEARERGEVARQNLAEGFSEESVGRLISERLVLIDQQVTENRPTLAATKGPAMDETGATGGTLAPKIPETLAIAPPLSHRVKHMVTNRVMPMVNLTSYNNLQRTRADTVHMVERLEALEGHVSRLEEERQALRERLGPLEAHVGSLEEDRQTLEERLGPLEEGIGTLTGEMTSIEARLGPLEDERQAMEARLDPQASERQTIEARLGPLEERVEMIATDTARIGHRMAARPYMAVDAFGAMGDRDQPMGYTSTPEQGPAPSFADLFRGSDEFIAERQRIYLPFFQGMERVVDLGCGRGEFLRLLHQQGVPAQGVEVDPALVARLRAEGFDMVEADAIAYLRDQPEQSLDGIFLAQVIEHLTTEQLVELLTVGRSRLRPRGVLIAETVNPESYEAMKTFYVDLTHQRPIFPQVLLQLCREAGFPSARIFYPLGGGFTQRAQDTAGEYAVVATAPG